jgi:hypothetical protein
MFFIAQYAFRAAAYASLNHSVNQIARREGNRYTASAV